MSEKRKLTTWLNGYYNYTVVLTYVGMLIGFFGILFALDGHFETSLVCLMLAGCCDMFDGTIASTRERNDNEKSFGIQIDSLSDLICFGVLPAILIICMCDGTLFAKLCGGLYVLCALIRLAYFNVCEEERQRTEEGRRQFYLGLPVTAAALILPAAYLLEALRASYASQGLGCVLLAMAIAFILPFHLAKPKKVGKILLVVAGALEFALLIMCFGLFA